MRIPLHLNKNENREDADAQRVMLHIAMAKLNPQGFRQQGKRSAPTRIERIAESVYGQ